MPATKRHEMKGTGGVLLLRGRTAAEKQHPFTHWVLNILRRNFTPSLVSYLASVVVHDDQDGGNLVVKELLQSDASADNAAQAIS